MPFAEIRKLNRKKTKNKFVSKKLNLKRWTLKRLCRLKETSISYM